MHCLGRSGEVCLWGKGERGKARKAGEWSITVLITFRSSRLLGCLPSCSAGWLSYRGDGRCPILPGPIIKTKGQPALGRSGATSWLRTMEANAPEGRLGWQTLTARNVERIRAKRSAQTPLLRWPLLHSQFCHCFDNCRLLKILPAFSVSEHTIYNIPN